jgi:endonuclease YncB( thermonuclease family)
LLGPPRQRQLAVRIAAPGGVLGPSRACARVATCVLAWLALRTATCRCPLRFLAPLLVVLAIGGCSEADLGSGGRAATSARVPGDAEPARLTKHTDGDTFYLSGIGKVRLIGIDTPEVYGEQECFGREASGFVEQTVPLGARVRYRLGVEERDRYGRALAFVWLEDGRFLNRMLVARGFAQPLTVPPNVEYEDIFVRAARRARESGRGLWGRPGCAG